MDFVITCIVWLIAAQIDFSDFRLVGGRYNYSPGASQAITWTGALLLLSASVLFHYGSNAIPGQVLTESLVTLIAYFLAEWILARINPQNIIISIIYRTTVLLAVYICHRAVINADFNLPDIPCVPVILCGLYFRNLPFGVVHGKNMHINGLFARTHKESARLRDIGTATRPPVYKVSDYGIVPDTRRDVTGEVQALIDRIGEHGGGTLFFPAGKYLFNKDKNSRHFIQINYSNITLEGEVSPEGEPLAELVCCNDLVSGDKNPWISPFLITTGEALQPSNNFWGLDFRNKRQMTIESSSLSDPGSDGTILSPDFATEITQDAMSGDRIIHVRDSSLIDSYIMIGMYNTTPDGNLIKDILGTDELRKEWLIANRAGREAAPSFQLLTKVSRIIDGNTLELAEPLPRNISLNYEPKVFNVPMLENIVIRNLRFSSKWNGLFRHHGFPLYYTIKAIQAMDYGWNCINMKRTSNGIIENLIIGNYTNPIYVMDSMGCSISHIIIRGYDGHQGLKVYCHACYNHFSEIRFYSHFADMLGGEGNAYCNTFENVEYLNCAFKPVDFDFHGFSEGPMSPPAYNTFRNIRNFRYIKGAGAITHLPSCAGGNRWIDIVTEGEKKGYPIFYAMNYREKNILEKYFTAAGYTAVMAIKRRKCSIRFVKDTFRNKIIDIKKQTLPRQEHYRLFYDSRIEDIQTTCSLPE